MIPSRKQPPRSEVLMQPFVSKEGWYTLEYPRMWEVEIIEDIPAFFDSISGAGALQVFAVQMGLGLSDVTETHPFMKGETLTEKMKLFLENHSISISNDDLAMTAITEKGDNDDRERTTYLVAKEYRVEDRFYMVCMLQKKNRFLLCLYNCAGSPSDEEAAIVGKIIQSIKIN